MGDCWCESGAERNSLVKGQDLVVVGIFPSLTNCLTVSNTDTGFSTHTSGISFLSFNCFVHLLAMYGRS